VQTLEASTIIQTLSFSKDSLYIETDRGLIDINSPSPRVIPCQKNNRHLTFVKDQWVIQGTRNFLWLPSDYRATRVAVYGSMLALGHGSGRVSFFEFDLENSSFFSEFG
jgi:hypothetical protein